MATNVPARPSAVSAFKICPYCQHEWPTAEDFERDDCARPLGLVVDFEDPWQTLVLFNHTCGSTLALRAEELRERLPPLEAELLADQPMCTRHCRTFGDLEPCPNPCRNAPLRNYVARLVRGRAPRDDHSPATPAPALDLPSRPRAGADRSRSSAGSVRGKPS